MIHVYVKCYVLSCLQIWTYSCPKKLYIVISEDLMFWGPNTRKSVLAERNSWGVPTWIAEVSELQSWSILRCWQMGCNDQYGWTMWTKVGSPHEMVLCNPRTMVEYRWKAMVPMEPQKRWSRLRPSVVVVVNPSLWEGRHTSRHNDWAVTGPSASMASPQPWVTAPPPGLVIDFDHAKASNMWNTAGCCKLLGQYSLPWKDMTNVYPQFGLDVETSWCKKQWLEHWHSCSAYLTSISWSLHRRHIGD